MQKYIVKNINTNEVAELDIDTQFIQEILEVGNVYVYNTNSYIKATQKEIDDYNYAMANEALTRARNAKIQELNAIYSHDTTWVFEVWSNKLSAGLVKDANWFAKMLPAITGNKKTILFDKNNQIKQISITNDEALAINNIITIEKSVEIKTKNLEIYNIINNALSIADVNAVNISEKFAEVDRFIDIDKLIKTNNGNGK